MRHPMNSESEEKNIERIPRYDEIVAFDPDEFVTAFTWAMNAVSGNAQIGDPAKLRLNLVEEDGSSMQLRFADTYLARITIAMKERYGKVNKTKYYSAGFRIFALIELLKSGKLASWVRPVPGETDAEEIADSVIEAAAVVRLNKQLKFPIREFIRKVKEIDATKES